MDRERFDNKTCRYVKDVVRHAFFMLGIVYAGTMVGLLAFFEPELTWELTLLLIPLLFAFWVADEQLRRAKAQDSKLSAIEEKLDSILESLGD